MTTDCINDEEVNTVPIEAAETNEAAAATIKNATDGKEQDDGFVWYFAIASMCNPISLANRDLTVLQSSPAIVMNYALHFFGPSGMAGAVKEDGASFHGVLHKMSSADKLKLDQIEMGYDAVPCTVELYDGTTNETALIYVMNAQKLHEYYGEKEHENQPPTERYLQIITEGCTHYGVDDDYIQHLKALEYQPRKDPSQFQTLPLSENLPTMTLADVAAADGHDGKPLYTTCNGKVLHHRGLPTQFAEKLQQYKIDKNSHSYEVWLHTMLYDPLYGVIKSQADVTKLCAASTEDQLVVWSQYSRRPKTTTTMNTIGKYESTDEAATTVVVGFIDLPYKDD